MAPSLPCLRLPGSSEASCYALFDFLLEPGRGAFAHGEQVIASRLHRFRGVERHLDVGPEFQKAANARTSAFAPALAPNTHAHVGTPSTATSSRHRRARARAQVNAHSYTRACARPCACVCASVRVCACACARALRARVRARARAHVPVRAYRQHARSCATNAQTIATYT